LELESDVLSRASPLTRALGSCLPIGAKRTLTLLDPAETGSPEGFLQARWRRHAAEADLCRIAPGLNGAGGAALTWQRILTNGCSALGSAGAERVYVAIAEDDQVALQLFRQAGFFPYTNDVLFMRPAGQPPATYDASRVVPEDTLHRHAISRLYVEGVPEAVQAHEEPSGNAWQGYPVGGWSRPLASPSVLLGPRGDVQAAWRAYRGPGGYWLHFVTGADRDADDAVAAGLGTLVEAPGFRDRPVFSAARGHEARLNLALREAGFEPLGRRFRLVKHTTARVLEPNWAGASVREGRFEATNPASSVSVRAARGTGTDGAVRGLRARRLVVPEIQMSEVMR
jgi:hypothetical protein